ncbi:hypothetical protein H0G86_000905 [Trichoderma simmonsii]|uniref:Uncharacterized protein n=1 Tax=Trichoderma simmonsii TaxID=1491479 RepID=A0A8G0L0J8_9HYPO|nr:hypothetical protein H0G86_000905 [Trichoderma simmonsii]
MREEDLNLLIELLLTKFLLTGLLLNKLWLLRGHRDIGYQLASPLPLRFGSSQAQLGPGWAYIQSAAGVSNHCQAQKHKVVLLNPAGESMLVSQIHTIISPVIHHGALRRKRDQLGELLRCCGTPSRVGMQQSIAAPGGLGEYFL